MQTRIKRVAVSVSALLCCACFTACGGGSPAQSQSDGAGLAAIESELLRDASGAPSGVNVFWPFEPDPLIAGYHIYQSAAPIPDSARGNGGLWVEYMGSPLIAVPVGSPAFVSVQLLFPVAIGETWYYRVTAVDEGGSESYLSAETSVTIAGHIVTRLDPTTAGVDFNVGIEGEHFGIYNANTDHVYFPGVSWQNGIGFTPAQHDAFIVDWKHTVPNRITALVPDGATTGQLDVSVLGVSQLTPEVFTNSDPYLTGLAPLSGAPRSFVTLTGANFGPDQDANHRVVLNGNELSNDKEYLSWSDTMIEFQIPDIAPGIFPLTVRVNATDSNQGWLEVLPALGPVWEHTWGNFGTDLAVGIVADTAGEVFLTGNSDSYSAEPNDILLMRYNAGGTFLWCRSWNNVDIPNVFREDNAADLAIDASDDLYITGFTQNTAGNDVVLLLKFLNGGQLDFGRTWESSLGEPCRGSAVICDGTNVYIAGIIEEADTDLLLIRYSLDGTFDGASRYALSGDQQPTDIVVDNAGDLIVVGNTFDAFGASGRDMFITKFDTDFNLLWSNFWGDINGDDEALGVAIEPSSNSVYVAGGTGPAPPGAPMPVLVVFESTGVLLSDDAWTVTAGAHFLGVYPVSSGRFLAVGSRGPTAADIVLLVLDTDLSTLLSWRYNTDTTYPVGLACGLDGDENVLICGRDASLSGVWSDEPMPRTEFTGEVLATIEGMFDAAGQSLTVNGSNRPAVGTRDTGGGRVDTLAIKYNPE